MPATTPTVRDTLLPGLMIHFVTWGTFTSQDRVAFLLHGLTASHKSFTMLGPALAAEGWYVIAPDLRGRGLSAKPPHGYSHSIHAHDILSLADQLGIERLVVIGHSMGALIAQYMAAFYPQRISNIVLIDSGGKVPDDVAQAIAVTVNRLGVPFPSLDAYLETMRQLPVIPWDPYWEAYFRYDAEVRADGTVVARAPKAAIMEESGATAMLRTEEFPRFITCPTLIARATVGTLAPDRGFVLPRDEAERLRGVIKQSELVEIPDTNHYTIVTSPILQAEIVRFLAG